MASLNQVIIVPISLIIISGQVLAHKDNVKVKRSSITSAIFSGNDGLDDSSNNLEDEWKGVDSESDNFFSTQPKYQSGYPYGDYQSFGQQHVGYLPSGHSNQNQLNPTSGSQYHSPNGGTSGHYLVPYHVPVNYPVPLKIRQPLPIHIPVPVPLEKTITVPIERPVHYPVVKPVPYKVIRNLPFPVPQHYPVPVPVYRTKIILHSKPRDD